MQSFKFVPYTSKNPSYVHLHRGKFVAAVLLPFPWHAIQFLAVVIHLSHLKEQESQEYGNPFDLLMNLPTTEQSVQFSASMSCS